MANFIKMVPLATMSAWKKLSPSFPLCPPKLTWPYPARFILIGHAEMKSVLKQATDSHATEKQH